MENLSNNGIHHIDGTYRITTHGFPLIVYGISDQVGRFHPVSFMLTSHETQVDFDEFYKGLINLANFFNIEYDPEYIMQDACKMLVKSNFTKLGPNKYQYNSFKSDNEFIIKTNCSKSHNKCSCSCKTYIKKGICLHAVAVSNIFGLNLFHPKYLAKDKGEYFVSKIKRGPKSKKGYGKALDKPSPIVPPKSSTPKSSPEPMNSKKARIEPEPEPNESPKIATKVRKVKVKGAEPSRKSSRKAK